MCIPAVKQTTMPGQTVSLVKPWEYHSMAVASGPGGPVLAEPVLAIAFTPAHAQVIKCNIQGYM